jgi:hemoglobin-like flavoprotein
VYLQPLNKYQLASFLTYAHHQPNCPDSVKAVTEKHVGVTWTAKQAEIIRASVSTTFTEILKEKTSEQVS